MASTEAPRSADESKKNLKSGTRRISRALDIFVLKMPEALSKARLVSSCFAGSITRNCTEASCKSGLNFTPVIVTNDRRGSSSCPPVRQLAIISLISSAMRSFLSPTSHTLQPSLKGSALILEFRRPQSRHPRGYQRSRRCRYHIRSPVQLPERHL